MANPFETYLAKIQADYRAGKATEYTYRSALETLLESLRSGVNASSDPKHIASGAPDFIVERHHVPLGYVETKAIGENLDKAEGSDQLKRYRTSLHNLILTDYLEFRWYVNGAKRLAATCATIGKAKKLEPDHQGIAKVGELLAEFYRTQVPTVATPKELAQRMAALTRITAGMIGGTLCEEGDSGVFHRQLNAFREFLLPALKEEEFADIYAQTMAYGLFAARVNLPAGKRFSRAESSLYLPQANPFLRKLFRDVGEELDGTPVAPFLDDLVELLNRANMEAILADFGRRTRTEDPVVHFYETFLAEYDPKLRKMRGVYYTPEPVVTFIARSVDHLLKTTFKRPQGLADQSVLLLDPATGTATFLYVVIRIIHDALVAHQQEGMWQDYAHEMLNRIFGFELLMAPYAVAHLKLGLLLSQLGYAFGRHERLGVYLTNTLEQGATRSETLGLAGYLSEEGSAAAEIKNQRPIMVVLGNPPYSGHSANNGKWISELVHDYYFVDGKPLHERQPKWLQDDYVKFIRFAQWRVGKTGRGIVGLITSHSYLDNPTFRGMRQSLLTTFDEIYVLDLHGNSKKQERSPDGSKDENVFDIQQGVALLLAIAKPEESQQASSLLARVHHADLWGTRAHKYNALDANTIASIKWTEPRPSSPSYLFVPQDPDVQIEYNQGWRLADIFPVNNVGFVTARDSFLIDSEERQLRLRIDEFRSADDHLSTHEIEAKYGLRNTSSWNVREARERLRGKSDWKRDFTKCLYRPFDKRHIYYSSHLLERPVLQIQRQMMSDNIGLISPRRVETAGPWRHVLCCDTIIDHVSVSLKTIDSLFPLYLYTTPADTAGTLFAQTETTRTANIAPAFVQAASDKLSLPFIPDGSGDLKSTIGPKDIFDYVYALLHSPSYRARYADFLKRDFPRVPLTSDRHLFARLASKGAELVRLHLLKSATLDNLITTFPIAGSNIVEKITYEKKQVRINDRQYFGNVPEDVWQFRVGGYQVCDKWLKDRKGRQLTGEEITHYQRIVVALNETIRIMKEIDKAIPSWPLR